MSMNLRRTTGTGWAAAVLGILLAAGCGTSAQTTLPPGADNPEVVAAYDDKLLTIDEFERRFTQATGMGSSAGRDSLAERLDFLERYVNFRLKVAAAEQAGLHLEPGVRDEIETYRSELARPYLLDREVLDPIIRELYDRRQQIVDASHILVRVPEGAPPEDTLQAYRALQAVRDSAVQDVDFGELAFRHSEDPSAGGNPNARGFEGRLGYFTGGSLVEPFESFAYDIPVRAISPVFRTQFGYHVLKVHDRRPALPDIRVSHIMIRSAPAGKDSALAVMNDLQAELDAGTDFAELAREHSQDVQSGSRGGDLGVISFTTPQLPPAFKDAAFGLEEVGDVSDVVETAYGLHLIKLTERRDRRSYEESYEELKTLAERLPRTRAAEAALARTIIEESGGRVDTARVLQAFRGTATDSVVAKLSTGRLSESVASDTFFVLGDSTFIVSDLADAVRQSGSGSDTDTEALVRRLVSSFVTDAAIDVEAARLEERDAEFERLMQEFRDGLILFELMEDSVWTAAEQDSAALRAYYEAHADSFSWPNRTRIISLQSPSDSLLRTAAARLDEGTGVERIYETYAQDTLHTLLVDTTMIADSTYSIYDRALELAAGTRTDVLPNRGSYIVLVNDGIEPPRQKTFEEARAEIVTVHQEIVEEQLVERLRQRYNAHTFPDRLENAYRDDASSTTASGTATGE